MSKIFKPNELVRVMSLPWKNYGEGTVHIGDIVTIHEMKPLERDWDLQMRFAVMKEFLLIKPQHNIGTGHLQSTGLRCNPSRNKREGFYLSRISK